MIGMIHNILIIKILHYPIPIIIPDPVSTLSYLMDCLIATIIPGLPQIRLMLPDILIVCSHWSYTGPIAFERNPVEFIDTP